MAVRDLSPSSWVAPGNGRVAISAQHSADSPDPINLDVWINNYSPYTDIIADLANGYNTYLVDGTHARLFIFIPPDGNTTSITLKGPIGDTGISVHPNCPVLLSLPASPAATSIAISCGAAITGCRFITI